MTDLANDLSSLSKETRQFLHRRQGLLINGECVHPLHRQRIPVLDPTSARQVSSPAAGSANDSNEAIDAATGAFEITWGSFGPSDRHFESNLGMPWLYRTT
jgi:hypothetical protein